MAGLDHGSVNSRTGQNLPSSARCRGAAPGWTPASSPAFEPGVWGCWGRQGQTVVLSHPQFPVSWTQSAASWKKMCSKRWCLSQLFAQVSASFLINLTCSTVFTGFYGTSITSRPLRSLIYIGMSRNRPYIFISGFLKTQTDIIFRSIFRTLFSFVCFR